MNNLSMTALSRRFSNSRITIIGFALLVSSLALAYIPSSQFVFERVAAIHGKGDYVIETEVQFHEGLEQAVIRENWLVVDGGEMRVAASGDGARIFRILKHGRVYWVDESNSEHADEISPDNIMRPLLTRSPAEEKKLFVNLGILPGETLKEKKLPKDSKDIVLGSESFVRLGRIAGAVTYAYGTPSTFNGPASPGLWIEQDAFTIRKVRTPDTSEISLNDYGNYSKGLAFPRTQSFVFNSHIVNVRVTRLNSITLNTDLKRQLDAGYFRNGHGDAATRLPKTAIGPVIQEFYKRFR